MLFCFVPSFSNSNMFGNRQTMRNHLNMWWMLSHTHMHRQRYVCWLTGWARYTQEFIEFSSDVCMRARWDCVDFIDPIATTWFNLKKIQLKSLNLPLFRCTLECWSTIYSQQICHVCIVSLLCTELFQLHQVSSNNCVSCFFITLAQSVSSLLCHHKIREMEFFKYFFPTSFESLEGRRLSKMYFEILVSIRNSTKINFRYFRNLFNWLPQHSRCGQSRRKNIRAQTKPCLLLRTLQAWLNVE